MLALYFKGQVVVRRLNHLVVAFQYMSFVRVSFPHSSDCQASIKIEYIWYDLIDTSSFVAFRSICCAYSCWYHLSYGTNVIRYGNQITTQIDKLVKISDTFTANVINSAVKRRKEAKDIRYPVYASQ
jgi:hypothetical protein